MNRDTLRQAANVVAVVATIVVNALANSLPINNLTTGEIANRFMVYFMPASWAFSIWGLIYVGLVAFVAYQALPSQANNPDLRRIGYLFVLSSAANIAWIFLWHYEYYVLTLIAMLVLLITLIAIYLRLNIGRRPVSTAVRWLVHVPFSIYLGWITVATIVNVTVVLDYVGWGGFGIGESVWAVIVLIVGAAIGAIAALRRHDAAYVLVLVWAYAAVAVAQFDTPLVAYSAIVLALILVVLAVLGVVRRGPQLAQQR